MYSRLNTRPLTFGERQLYLNGSTMDCTVVYVEGLGYRAVIT